MNVTRPARREPRLDAFAQCFRVPWAALLLAACTAATAGCGTKAPTVDPRAIDPHREPVTRQLAALADLERQLPTVQVTSAVAALPLDGIRFGDEAQLAGRVSLSSRVEGPMPDGVIFDASVFGPSHRPNFDFQLGASNTFVESARTNVASREGVAGTTDLALESCRRLEALRFVIVMRPTTLALPDTTSVQSQFRPGVFAGEALVFRLEPGRATFLGGFPIAATSSDTVRVRWQQGREHERRTFLVTDLRHHAYVSFHDALLARAPGARIAPTSYYRSAL